MKLRLRTPIYDGCYLRISLRSFFCSLWSLLRFCTHGHALSDFIGKKLNKLRLFSVFPVAKGMVVLLNTKKETKGKLPPGLPAKVTVGRVAAFNVFLLPHVGHLAKQNKGLQANTRAAQETSMGAALCPILMWCSRQVSKANLLHPLFFTDT